jgi:hypothetical protein
MTGGGNGVAAGNVRRHILGEARRVSELVHSMLATREHLKSVRYWNRAAGAPLRRAAPPQGLCTGVGIRGKALQVLTMQERRSMQIWLFGRKKNINRTPRKGRKCRKNI